MLTIGFATKYYTLWDVSGPHKVDYGTHIATVIRHTYIQNLSFDFDKAKEKVEERIGSDKYDIDLSLRGAKSFEKSLSVEYNPDQMLFGQHVGKPFSEVGDDGYLLWYFRQTENTEKFSPKLKDYLIDNGLLFELSDGTVLDRDGLDRHIKDVFTKEVYQLGHFETEGERITKELSVRSMWSYEGMYGWVDVVEMTDTDCNLYYVRGSMKGVEDVNEGDEIVLDGTVSHKEWFDRKLGGQRKETQLKRPKLKQVFS